jgi:hypothetical protein
MRHSWTKYAFWVVNKKKWRKWWRLLHCTYLLTLMVYLFSQWTPSVQIMYFMFDWSIYRLFVLHRAWQRDSLQIMSIVYICSTWGIVVIKKRFETWIMFFFLFDCSIYRLFMLNTGWKRDSLQIIIFVYVCLTWDVFEIKNLFWDVNNKKWRKWCKFVSPFLSNSTFGLIVLTKGNKCPNEIFYVRLVDLQTMR